MKERTIMIFPKFKNIEIINEIRNKYDPLADKVNPHITIVFPFACELKNEEIESWIKNALTGMHPFELELFGISKHVDNFGNYLFLNVQKGQEEIIRLSQLLYNNILKKFKSDLSYIPHMTIGKFKNEEQLISAFGDIELLDSIFTTVVDTISVEMIGPNEESIIEIEHKLF